MTFALSTVVLGAFPCWAAGPKTVWARTGAAAAAMETDLADCSAQSKSLVAHADPSDTSRSIAVYGTAGAGAALVGELLAEAIDTPGLRSHAVRTCMYGRGYHAIALTQQETTELFALKSPAAALSWMEGFYARPEYGARLADATAPPFPDARTEPFTYGAVRLDPDGLIVAKGPVTAGGVLLSGVASHRRTGRLLRDLPVAQYYGGGRLASGAVFHQAVFQEGDGKDHTYWCGAFKGTFETAPTCIRSDGMAYRLVSPDGANWVTTGLDLHADPGAADPDGLWLDESADDLIGPMQFALVLGKLTPTTIVVAATVTRGDDTETIWRDALPRRPDGSAVLPLWSRRLILAPEASGVSASLATDGDGSGWRYVHLSD